MRSIGCVSSTATTGLGAARSCGPPSAAALRRSSRRSRPPASDASPSTRRTSTWPQSTNTTAKVLFAPCRRPVAPRRPSRAWSVPECSCRSTTRMSTGRTPVGSCARTRRVARGRSSPRSPNAALPWPGLRSTTPMSTSAARASDRRRTAGRSWRVAKRGGAPMLLAEGQIHPSDIAVDHDFVYWSSRGSRSKALADGSVERLAKPVATPAPE